MKLLFGTANPAKLAHMQDMLAGLPLELIGLKDLNRTFPSVPEDGNVPLENARIKAEAYYRETGMPVFSCDSGLFLDGVKPGEQPGVHVRRVRGKVLSDEEMIDYYSGLAAHYGGTLKARYRNAIVLILDNERVFAHDGDDIASIPFLLSSVPHPDRNPGFPLDSLSLDPETGAYLNDIGWERPGEKRSQSMGFQEFFRRAGLGQPIR